MLQEKPFDRKLAKECAEAFAGTTEVGCVVSDAAGNILHESGYGCASCRMCRITGHAQEQCRKSQIYGMTESERFGGKYIYFCPLGLTCFVSPILGSSKSEATITVGPFLMVDRQDYIACDLIEQQKLDADTVARAAEELNNLPVLPPEKVNKMSTLLFMAVGFMNNVSAANRMLDTQSSVAIQEQVTGYIQRLKTENPPPPYPFETERSLLRAIGQSDKLEAQRLLNELFGYIFFSAGGDFEQAKSRIYELLVLISRTAVDAGADPTTTLRLSHRYMQEIPRLGDVDSLCFWLASVMNDFMDRVFNFMDAKHANAIHQSIQYLNTHCAEHVTLEEMARRVYLSPTYFSRIFKKETGQSFTAYLNKARIERSKGMLLHSNMRLTDIALQVGFEDQSYFTKVFKKHTGVVPLKFRDTRGGAK